MSDQGGTASNCCRNKPVMYIIGTVSGRYQRAKSYSRSLILPESPTGRLAASRLRAGGAASSAGQEFHRKVGAFFGVSILTESECSARLRLGSAFAVQLEFETQAPVDDIVVRTSERGYIAIQAKTRVSLSQKPSSEFCKTVSQFVRALACLPHG